MWKVPTMYRYVYRARLVFSYGSFIISMRRMWKVSAMWGYLYRALLFWPPIKTPLSVVLQCVAVCCSVLQCVAVCCSMLQFVAVCCSVLSCVLFWPLIKPPLSVCVVSFSVLLGLFWCLNRALLVSEHGSFGVLIGLFCVDPTSNRPYLCASYVKGSDDVEVSAYASFRVLIGLFWCPNRDPLVPVCVLCQRLRWCWGIYIRLFWCLNRALLMS